MTEPGKIPRLASVPGRPAGSADKTASSAEAQAAETLAVVEQLVRDHHAELYRYAYRLTGAVADAEDLTQQTFLIAQTSIPHLRDGAAARKWLFTVLRNTWLKSRRKRQPTPAASLEIDVDSVPQELPTEEIDQEGLQTALDQLPEEFKLVLLLFYFEECSYQEIAQRLDIPPGTVMSRLSRAKSHLRRKLFPG